MKIGCANHPRKKIIPEIKWIAENGFDFVDLFLEPDVCEPTKLNSSEIIKILKNTGLDTIGHTACYLPIGSPLKNLRGAAIESFIEYLDFFKKLDCKKVTIHANWPGGMFNDEDGLKYQIESLLKIIEYSEIIDITVMYEPINTQSDSVENVKKILKAVQNLAFHADIGHCNLHNRKPIEYIKHFKNKLEHIHLHDNNGWADLHLPMGTGNIDWDPLIKFLKSFYDKTITLEIFSLDKDYILLSLNKLKNKWRGLKP